jgi:hypothetical protein
MGVEMTEFSGGEIVVGSAVWNRDPLPPKKPAAYRLTVARPENQAIQLTANSQSMDKLLQFNVQAEGCGYEFMKLERVE